MDGAGVIAAGTFDYDEGAQNGVYLLDARNGTLLATLDTRGAQVFAQPVFAGAFLYVGTTSEGLLAFTSSA